MVMLHLSLGSVRSGTASIGVHSRSVIRYSTDVPPDSMVPCIPSTGTLLFAPPEPSCTPGAPARLRLSPGAETIAPGEEVCFRARVVDAAGCRVPGARVELSLEGAEGREGSLRGRCFRAGASAAEAEGEFRIRARSDGLRANARVTVQAEDLSHLTARQLRERRNGEEALSDAEAEGASAISARAVGGSGVGVWIGVGATVLLVLAGVVLLLLRRRRGDEEGPEDEGGAGDGDGSPGADAEGSFASPAPAAPSAPASAPAAPREASAAVGATARAPRRVCPVCGREDEDGNGFCPVDGTRLMDPEAPEVRAQGMICPACRRGYPATAKTCAQDGEALVPYAMFVAQRKQEEAEVKKICPTCGTTYDAGTTFCGKDGSTLTTLN